MKKHNLITTIIFTFFTIFCSLAQVTGISNAAGTNYEMTFVPRGRVDNSAEFNKIAPKMYLTENYQIAKVGGISDEISMRYNIYKDEMEFLNGEKVLYLKKSLGRKVYFKNANTHYEIFKHNEKLKYFEVLNKDNIKLLVKQVVKYQEAKAAQSTYQKDKPADFKRKSDKMYIKLNDEIVELPSKNKKFLPLLGSKSNEVKKFMKKNKLKVKNKKDMLKIVNYINKI